MRFAAVLTLLACSCASSVETPSLADAEALCLDQKYAEAIPILRAILREQPLDAGAHYYLGLCYLASDLFRPLIADGEFETALRLYGDQRGVSPIARFDPKYFEMMCHINRGKTAWREIGEILAAGGKRIHVEPRIARMREYAEAARAVLPEADEVAWLDGVIHSLEPAAAAQPKRHENETSTSG